RHLHLHQLSHHQTQRLAQEVEPLLTLEQVADDLLSRHPLRLGHRDDSSRRCPGRPDESEHHGRRTTRLPPTPSYTTLRDRDPAPPPRRARRAAPVAGFP